jgi:hypothetical protein
MSPWGGGGKNNVTYYLNGFAEHRFLIIFFFSFFSLLHEYLSESSHCVAQRQKHSQETYRLRRKLRNKKSSKQNNYRVCQRFGLKP